MIESAPQRREERKDESRRAELAATAAVDAGLKVHRALGPGLLESAYEHCLAFELTRRGLYLERQVCLPIVYENITLEANYRLDIVVDHVLIIEIKAVELLLPLHHAQILTYLKLSGMHLGLLMNFNVALFRQGLKRVALS
jgi:GxxExxY protein